MTELYAVPCPKCRASAWGLMGGHHGIPRYLVCANCGLDQHLLREVLRQLDLIVIVPREEKA